MGKKKKNRKPSVKQSIGKPKNFNPTEKVRFGPLEFSRSGNSIVCSSSGIVNLSEFDQKLGHTRMHHSLIVQH